MNRPLLRHPPFVPYRRDSKPPLPKVLNSIPSPANGVANGVPTATRPHSWLPKRPSCPSCPVSRVSMVSNRSNVSYVVDAWISKSLPVCRPKSMVPGKKRDLPRNRTFWRNSTVSMALVKLRRKRTPKCQSTKYIL
jgi:hypothetical protein